VNCTAVVPAAFPGDPADTPHSVHRVAALGNHWRVTRAAIGSQVAETREVDAGTGAEIP
jgi:hypothetical protein